MAKAINYRCPIAYTTVMTVMGHLVDRGLPVRTREGKRYRYRVVQSMDEFLHEISGRMVHTLVNDFGPNKFVAFKDMTFERYENEVRRNPKRAKFNGSKARLEIERICGRYEVNLYLADQLKQWAKSLGVNIHKQLKFVLLS